MKKNAAKKLKKLQLSRETLQALTSPDNGPIGVGAAKALFTSMTNLPFCNCDELTDPPGSLSPKERTRL